MIESKLTEISQEFNCDYDLENKMLIGLGSGARSPGSVHKLNPRYKETTIHITLEFGLQDLAQIGFELESNPFPKFTVSIKSHFYSLITFSKRNWKVSSKNKQVISDIKILLDKSKLTEIAREEAFEPIIVGEMKNKNLIVKTVFYLGFNNKEEAIRPIILFHQLLIDYVKEHYCR